MQGEQYRDAAQDAEETLGSTVAAAVASTR
jgi:hypothetical protein